MYVWGPSETTAGRLLTGASLMLMSWSPVYLSPHYANIIMRRACLRRWKEENHSCLVLKQIVWGTFLSLLFSSSNSGPIQLCRYASRCFFFIIIIIHEANGVSGIFVKGLLCLCQTLKYSGPAAVQHRNKKATHWCCCCCYSVFVTQFFLILSIYFLNYSIAPYWGQL